ncbi:GNAT family N-acetyltransferase [Actinomyces sp. zg-332]|uniref:GNAT family N-acetyltransferase n=1 Tax=Actinomyces sp. zg-332 TaxID=2708340 RepID=UPI0014213A7C|nr:GNAT family N-acetyltransferase [Actinomyces sp. zg-332]QPK94648.1 GNAT family N-acetyltransferase [Actinomyces sp. zg-332]
MSLPVENLNITWKTLDNTSAKSLHSLIHKIEVCDCVTYNTEEYEIQEIFESEQKYCIGGFTPDNELIAYAVIKTTLDKKTVHCLGGVDPQYRGIGIGTYLLSTYEQITVEMLKDDFDKNNKVKFLNHNPKKEGYVVVEINDTKKELKLKLDELGFLPKNRFYELRKKIDKPYKHILLPTYKKIVDWQENLEELVRKTNNNIGEQYLNLPTLDIQQWQYYMRNANKKWCKILLDKSTDRSKIIGYIVSSKYEQDWKVLNHKEAYIDLITVIPKKEQSILVKALIQSYINTCIDDGLDYVAIGLEPDKQPELYNILMEMGFEVSNSSTEYVKSIQI